MLNNETLNTSVYRIVSEVQDAAITDPHCTAYRGSDTVHNVTNDQSQGDGNLMPGSAEWNRSVCAITTLNKGKAKLIFLQYMLTSSILLFISLEIFFLTMVSCIQTYF